MMTTMTDPGPAPAGAPGAGGSGIGAARLALVVGLGLATLMVHRASVAGWGVPEPQKAPPAGAARRDGTAGGGRGVFVYGGPRVFRGGGPGWGK